MPTEFGKKMKKKTSGTSDLKKLQTQAKKMKIKLSKKTSDGKSKRKSAKELSRDIKRARKAAPKKKTKKTKKKTSRYGSTLVSGSSGYSNGAFTLSGCPTSTDGKACGPGVSTYSSHLLESYPGTYIDPIAYSPGTAPAGANSWSANTPALHGSWPKSEGFRSSYGKLLKRRNEIIKKLNALSRR